MEDALAHCASTTCNTLWNYCLNPCFNGRCTRTMDWEDYSYIIEVVLILVLMEDALALTLKSV